MGLLPRDEAEQRRLAIFAGLLGLTLLGAAWFVWKSDSEPEMQIIRLANGEDKAEGEKLFVDVEGAVVNPGVYEIKEGDRIGGVIEMAGGITEDADVGWIELHINKAEKITDGYKLYLPRINEATEGVFAGKNALGIISVNYANQKELESLPGVGEVTAGKIIQGRPYSKVDDLRERKIVTQKVFEQIQPLIGL